MYVWPSSTHRNADSLTIVCNVLRLVSVTTSSSVCFFFSFRGFCFCKRQLVGNVLLYILHVCENGKKKKFPRVTVLMLLSFGMNVPSR